MLARSISFVFAALTAVHAWPIFFYENNICNHYPAFTLYEPPVPGTCNHLGNVDIKAYSGGTKDAVQKLVFYDDEEICYLDAAHRVYFNQTITNGTNLCVPTTHLPRTYVFIEELLPIKTKSFNPSACETPLRVQN